MQPVDPYAPPAAFGPPPAPGPAFTLHTPNHVALATFLGSPFAGALVLANNYRKLGRGGAAALTLAVGLVGTAALLGLAFALPAHSPAAAVPMVAVAAMYGLGRWLQGDALLRHRAAGGREASGWVAAGFGAASMVVVLVVAAFAGMALPERKLSYGPDQDVIYEEGAKEADARAVGDALRSAGFFAEPGARTVRVSRDGAWLDIGFVVKDGTWNDADTVNDFKELGRAIQTQLPAHRLRIKLQSEWMMTKKTFEP